MDDLKTRVEKLEKELKRIQDDRFYNLSARDVEKLKNFVFERTATNISGSITGALVVTYNGKRKAIPTYSNFPT